MINAVNEQFSRFVNFAQERFDAGKETAIATKGDVQAKGGTPLEERGITVTDKSDWVGKSLFRKQDAKDATDAELGNGMPEFTIDDFRQEEI